MLVGVLPLAADCFQEREVSRRLETALAAGQTAILTGSTHSGGSGVLSGMGGVGKTQLAAAHARRALASRTAAVVVWVTASSRQAIIDAYAQAATTLGLPGCAGTDPPADASHFLTWTTTTGRSWLVILDDIQDPKDVSKLWPPADAQGRVLATTRRRDAALAGQGRRLVSIDTYTPAEARAYLTDRLTSHHRAEPTEQIDGLADDLGCLPLALAQAAAYLIDDGITIAAYRALLAEQTLEGVKPDSLPDDHEQIVARTWALSIDRANTAHPAGMARPLLEMLSVLDPNGIPYSVLTSPPVLVRLAVDTPDQVRRGLRVLHGFNLITHNPDATHREIRVHQLIQRATYEALTPNQQLDTAYLAADALQKAWPDIESDELGAILRANTTALRETTGIALWQRNNKIHPLLFRGANSIGGALQPAAAVAEFTQLHITTEEIFGPDHHSTLELRLRATYWRGRSGDEAGAVAAFEELLTDMLRVLGPDHPDTLVTRYELANCRVHAGDTDRAVAELKSLLADDTRVIGALHHETLTTRFGLAQALQAAGDRAAAAAMFEELLADDIRVLGPDHPHVLTDRYTLALLHESDAEVIAALEHLRTDELRILGPRHPDSFSTRRELARRRVAAGDTAEALAELEELLADQTQTVGADHPETRTTQDELQRQALLYARALTEQAHELASSRHHEEAIASYQEAIRLNPDYAEAHKGLGNLFRQLGRHEAAITAYRHVIRLGSNDPQIHQDLGDTLTSLGRHEEAQSAYYEATRLKSLASRRLGDIAAERGNHEEAILSYREAARLNLDDATTHNSLGDSLFELGRFAEAEAALRRAIEINPDYAVAHNDLGATLFQLGRFAEAEAALRRAIEINPDYAVAHNDLGATLFQLGRFAEAEAALRRAIEINPDYTKALRWLGSALYEVGRFVEAEAALRRAIEINPDYAQAHFSLGRALLFRGAWEEARAELRQGGARSEAELLRWIADRAETAPGERLGGSPESALAALAQPLPSDVARPSVFRLAEVRALALAGCGHADEAVRTLRAAMGERRPSDRFARPLYDLLAHPEPVAGLVELREVWREIIAVDPSAATPEDDRDPT
ncbi:tetratricopeptide repeat protein [Streptomyces sp. NPDC058268]|uniref:tetratricopeptide repeat protein n=1 Tax=Streptomyces sp. NPDC058268 TaxID=3346413 RepID=UPI0036EC4812